MTPKNHQVILKSRPTGIPQAEHFEITTTDLPDPDDGDILIRIIYWSVEPAMKGWVNAIGNYSDPVAVGDVMRSFATGIIQTSRDPRFVEGSFVTGMFGWQAYACVRKEQIDRVIDPDENVPLSTSLGIMGLNGLTAYFGLLDCGQPSPGETIVVSTAAGAVGSAVGQIAKYLGCRTVGIAGGADKCRQCIADFGFDACIDYKSDGDIQQQLTDACPDGVDVYFDNTAGSITDSVMTQLNLHARIIICGTASVESWDPVPQGPRVERHMLVNRASMRGILIFDYADRYDEGRQEIAKLIKSGHLRFAEDILPGIEHAPDAIAGLYRGENRGKRLIQVSEDPTLPT